MAHNVIPVQEDFDKQDGTWENYEAYDTAQKFALLKQRHVDIRSFESEDMRVPLQMIHLNQMTMDEMNGKTMTDLTGTAISRAHEPWSNGTVEPQADRNNWNGLTLTLAVGTNVTQSVVS